ncbi:MAG: YigZ family protein [Rikenellaceae bacterium]
MKKVVNLWDLKTDSYYTITRDAVSEIKEKGSRFIAYAYKVTDVSEVEAKIAALKKEHYNARHHCYAYRIGLGGAINRANDDGEPSSTAGRPILGQMLSADVSDVLVVVVRYFGGILLGTSGLIVAYKGATASVLEEAGREEKVLREWVEVEVGYAEVDKVMKIVKRRELPVAPMEYRGVGCVIKIEVRESEKDDLLQEINNKY